MKKLLIMLTLFVLIISSSFSQENTEGKLYIQIRDEVEESTTSKGEVFWGSYFYCLISFPAIKYDMYFSGNPDTVMDIIKNNLATDKELKDVFTLKSSSYNQSKDYIIFTVSDIRCRAYGGNFCDYETIVTRYRGEKK